MRFSTFWIILLTTFILWLPFITSCTTSPDIATQKRVPATEESDAYLRLSRAAGLEMLTEWDVRDYINRYGESSGLTARLLSTAAEYGSVGTIEMLIFKFKVDPNLKVKGNTAIYKAIKQGHFMAVKRLVELGATLTVKNTNGETPLEYARRQREWNSAGNAWRRTTRESIGRMRSLRTELDEIIDYLDDDIRYKCFQ